MDIKGEEPAGRCQLLQLGDVRLFAPRWGLPTPLFDGRPSGARRRLRGFLWSPPVPSGVNASLYGGGESHMGVV